MIKENENGKEKKRESEKKKEKTEQTNGRRRVIKGREREVCRRDGYNHSRSFRRMLTITGLIDLGVTFPTVLLFD